MKTHFLFLAFFLNALPAFCQEKIFELRLPEEFRTKLIASTTHSTEKSTFQHYLLATKNKISHIYLFHDGRKREVSSEIVNDTDSDSDTINNATFDDSKIISLYRSSKYLLHIPGNLTSTDVIYRNNSTKYYIITTDMKSGEIKVTDTLKKSMGVEFVGCFSKRDTIFLLQHLLSKNYFTVTTKPLKGDFAVDTIKIKFPEEQEIKIGNFTKNETPQAIHTFPSSNIWIPLYLADSKNAAFQNQEHLYILINNPSINVSFIDIDIVQKKYESKQIAPGGSIQGKSKISASSWLADHVVISGFTTGETIKLFFYNLRSDQFIDSLTITNDNFQRFATSSVIKTGDFWSKSNVKESSFNEFMKKVKSNRLLITGYQKDGELFLTMGTRFDIVTSTFIGNVLTLGMLDFKQTKPPTMLTFDLSLKLPTLEPALKETRNFVWEKILMFIWGRRNDLRYTFMEFQNGHYYLTHYDHQSKKLTTYRYYQFL